jgi:hypothetical protein
LSVSSSSSSAAGTYRAHSGKLQPTADALATQQRREAAERRLATLREAADRAQLQARQYRARLQQREAQAAADAASKQHVSSAMLPSRPTTRASAASSAANIIPPRSRIPRARQPEQPAQVGLASPLRAPAGAGSSGSQRAVARSAAREKALNQRRKAAMQ